MLKRTLICSLLVLVMIFNTGCENTMGINRMILGTIFIGGGIGALVAKEGPNSIPIYTPGISTGQTYESGPLIPISTTPTNELEILQLNGPFNYVDTKNNNKPYTAFYGIFKNKKAENVIKVIYRIRYYNSKGSAIIDDANFQEVTLKPGQNTPFRVLYPKDDKIRYAQIYEFVSIITSEEVDENSFMFTQVQKLDGDKKLEGYVTALNSTTPLVIIGAFYDDKGNLIEVNFIDGENLTFDKSTVPELGSGDKTASFNFNVSTVFSSYTLTASYKSDEDTVLENKINFTKPSGIETVTVNTPYIIQFTTAASIAGQNWSLYADPNEAFDGNEIALQTGLTAGTETAFTWTPTQTGSYHIMGFVDGETFYSVGSLNVVEAQ